MQMDARTVEFVAAVCMNLWSRFHLMQLFQTSNENLFEWCETWKRSEYSGNAV